MGQHLWKTLTWYLRQRCVWSTFITFCSLTASTAPVNLNKSFKAYRSKCLWITGWHDLCILKDDFVSTMFIAIKSLQLSILSYHIVIHCFYYLNEMISDWLLTLLLKWDYQFSRNSIVYMNWIYWRKYIYYYKNLEIF